MRSLLINDMTKINNFKTYKITNKLNTLRTVTSQKENVHAKKFISKSIFNLSYLFDLLNI